MSTRLTNDIRAAICEALLKHRFTDAVTAHAKDMAAFALEVYEDKYKKAARAAMNSLPDGWLYESSDINVTLGASYQRLNFNGSEYGDLAKFNASYGDTVTFRVLAKDKGVCANVYDAGSNMASRYEKLRAKSQDLKTQITEARRQVGAALSSVTTVKRLIETWPEIEPFARKFEGEKSHLPALPTDALNAILDLPVAA